MKHVKNRQNRRKAMAQKIRQSKDLLKTKLNEDLVKKTIDKVGLKGLSNIVNSKNGVEMISRELGHKVSKKDVADIRTMLNEKTSPLDTNSNLLKKKFFYPFRGVWFFDIFVNRKLKENTNNEYVLVEMGVFTNGNSGFVRIYEMADKTKQSIKAIYEQFINDCHNLKLNGMNINYPVKKIISDDEPGVPESLPGVEIVKVKQTGTNHVLLSKINAFASGLRKFNASNHNGEQYISDETAEYYTKLWNMKKLPFVLATRKDMMCDVKIEEAYISACMVENISVKEAIDETFKADDLVKIKETDEAFKGNPQVYGKEKTATYKIIESSDGKLQLQNTANPEDIRRADLNMITRQVVDNRDNLNTYLANNNMELPAHDPRAAIDEDEESQFIRMVRTPQQKETNKEIATAMGNATTARRGREVLELQAGEKNMNYKPPKDEDEIDLVNIHNLSQAELTEIARKFVEQEMKDDFDLGFITNWKPEEQYARMEEFIRTIPPQFVEQFFGDALFYQKKKKKDVSKTTRIKLSANLKQLLEDPEFRKVYDTPHSTDHKNIIANMLGHFIKNKPGPKQK